MSETYRLNGADVRLLRLLSKGDEGNIPSRYLPALWRLHRAGIVFQEPDEHKWDVNRDAAIKALLSVVRL